MSLAAVIEHIHVMVSVLNDIHPVIEGTGPLKPLDMYRYMLHPELGTDIVFLGMARPTIGSIPPIGELQARWLCKMLSDEEAVPSPESIRYKVQEWNVKKWDMFAPHYQKKSIVEYVPFLDELAEDIGCRPNPWSMLTKPTLLWKVIFFSDITDQLIYAGLIHMISCAV